MSDDFDPLVPRNLDRPRAVPLHEGADLSDLDGAKILAAPDDPAQWPVWRERLQQWRAEARTRIGADDALYERPDLAWAARCYVVSQVWLWDEMLYDWVTGAFTPERLVADARDRFGGFDGVVLWHAYPVIGIDDRNQWDFYRSVEGLPGLVADLHDLGVKVFVDYNPWDVGTRRGRDDAGELAALVADLDVDGVFLDTLKEGDDGLLDGLRAARPGVAVEGESTVPLTRLGDHPLSWAQWFADSPTPGVVRSHWFERRHQMHHVRRWHRDHSEELQSAWLNGIGVLVWEVVFGVWVGWSDRDAQTLRRMSAAQRALSRLLVDSEWTPLVDLGESVCAAGVFGSSFTVGAESLLTLVNRCAEDTVVPVDAGDGVAYDVWTGRRLRPGEGATVPGHGIGGVWRTSTGADATWLTPLSEERGSGRFPYRVTERVAPAPATGAPAGPHVVVPAGSYPLTVRYRNRETGLYGDAPFVDEWKPLTPRLHDQRTVERRVALTHPVAVASLEVTDATGRPVTGVTLDEARTVAASVGARLPTEDEWQLAAALPGFERARPEVWNLTESEHRDGRTRFVMLKGGSAYRADGSAWYFDGGVRDPEFTAKYLIPGGAAGRSSSVGFRLAWDRPGGDA